MTIALVIKVNDGVVLAADSATTMMGTTAAGQQAVWNIYNNANKLFNLHKGLPIGAMTWGLGNVGPASISTLAKDIRQGFHGDGPRASTKLKVKTYDVASVAAEVKSFLYDEQYKPQVEDQVPAEDRPELGFLVAGYSAGSDEPTVHVLTLGSAAGPDPVEVLKDTTGAMWWGQPEAITRIVTGLSVFAPAALENMALGLDEAQRIQFAAELRAQVQVQMFPPAMPIQDAIDIAHFLVDATIRFVRFTPGENVVGGPIEIATITKHEGFKWVERKHFFDARLNPTTEAR